MATIETGSETLTDTIDQSVTVSITFTEEFNSTPAVVGYIPTRGGGQSIVHRFQNVTTTGCDVFMVEPDDEAHATETVVWMAVEPGSHDFSGTRVDAGIETTSAVHNAPDAAPSNSVSYTGGSFASVPTVLHSLNTNNNNDFMASGCSSNGTSSANIYQEAAETSTSTATEDIGWVAIEQVGSITLDGTDADVDQEIDGSSDGVDDTSHSLGFNRTFSSVPDIIVSGHTLNGADGYWARGAGTTWSTTSHDVYAEEDQVVDTEQSHADEEFGYFAIEPNAVLTAESIETDTPTLTSVSSSNLTATEEIFIVAPTDLSATNAGTAPNVDLSWTDNLDFEDQYNIYRSTESGTTVDDYTQIDTVGADVTTYTDTTTDFKTQYFYRVSATGTIPDPASLDVTSTLNGDSVTLYGYEDTDSDGIANNTDSWTLTGGTEELDVSAFDLSAGNEFWFEVVAEDDGTITDAVEQIDVTLNY